jgi:iron complex outermembrane receptor protein
VGFQWKPIADLKIRGNYNEGFRAPTILELFRGVSDNFPTLADPCLSGQFGARSLQTADAIARCNSGFAGISAVPLTNGFAPVQDNGQIRTQVGGEATLTPESSESITLGFVYSPSWFEGFDVTMDYWRVDIDNVIGGRNASTLLTQCYRDGNVQACQRITRNPTTGLITNILATGENIGFTEISGIDTAFSYRLPEFDFGQFDLRLDTTYFIKEEAQNLAFNPTAPFNYHTNNPINSTVGNYADRGTQTPRWKANFKLDWVLGSWSANWTARYLSGAIEPCGAAYVALAPNLCDQVGLFTANGRPLPRNNVGSVTYHDASVAYAADWDATIRVGASNILDRDPPFSTGTFANSFDPQNDVPGRFWFVSYTQNF